MARGSRLRVRCWVMSESNKPLKSSPINLLAKVFYSVILFVFVQQFECRGPKLLIPAGNEAALWSFDDLTG